MTAFAGIVRYDGPVAESWIETLFARPVPAGHVWHVIRDGPAVFGRSGPVAGGPAVPSAPIVLAASRLDNTAALQTALGIVPGTDDEALARAAYQRWGDRFAEHLLGDFAIAAWDSANGRLVLSRDALGTHAIHYVRSGAVFAFATDLRALLALPFVRPTLHEERIADTLRSDGSGQPDATFYDQVKSVPSAHSMTVASDRVSLTRYWSASSQPAIALRRDDDYADALRQRISEAVECRLRGGRTIAVHLSGGIDSSAVACLAARALRKQGRRLLALCSVLPAGYDGPESDERPFIDAVLAQEDNIDVAWIEPRVDDDVFGAHVRWFETLGQPPLSNVTHIEALLGEAGRSRGADVVLSGFGGDLFASVRGTGAIRDLIRAGRWGTALRELAAVRRQGDVGWARLVRREVVGPLVPLAWRRRHSLPPCIDADLAARVDQRRGRGAERAFEIMASKSTRGMMEYIMEPGRMETPLASISQVFAREFSQSLRFPLLDRRVIELMLGVPPEQLHRGGWPRSLMRRAMDGIIPDVIRLRLDKGAAFDPAITSRIVAGRQRLEDWVAATTTRGAACWQYVDRHQFLDELAAISPAPRERWRPGTFQTILTGGLIARFIDWHEQTYGRAQS